MRDGDKTDLVLAKIRELPPLPKAAASLLRVTCSDKSSAEDVTRILSADQALAGKILKLANSSFYGQSGQVSTITRAVVVLGFSTIRNLALGLSACAAIKKLSGQVDIGAFWNHTVCAAAGAQMLAEVTHYPEPEEAFVTGLLHDIGQLVLACALPAEFAKVQAARPRDITAAEEQALGITHTKVGQKLLRRWALPDHFLNAVRFHHNPQIAGSGEEPLVSLVALADILAMVEGQTLEGPAPLPQVAAYCEPLGLTLPALADILPRMEQQIENTRVFLRIAAGEDIKLPEADPTILKATVLSANADRAAWVRGLLNRFGHQMVQMRSYLTGAAEARDVQLALFDPVGVASEMMRQVGEILARTRAVVGVLVDEDGASLPPGFGDHPRVPLVFSRQDLLGLMSGAPLPQGS